MNYKSNAPFKEIQKIIKKVNKLNLKKVSTDVIFCLIEAMVIKKGYYFKILDKTKKG